MAKRLILSSLLAASLAGCGVGPLPGHVGDPSFLGGTDADVSYSGLAFADGTQLLADVEGESITVKLARFVHDETAGTTEIVITDETATIPVGFLDRSSRDVILTIDGTPVAFTGGVGTLDSGQSVWSYLNYALTQSGTGGIYAYEGYGPAVANSIDMEGVYAFGFETDPTQIDARSDTVNYAGSYFGYGQMLDLDGAVTESEVETTGAIQLQADFGTSTISARLAGELDVLAGVIPYELIFVGADIVGSGFVGGPDMTCSAGYTCSSATSVGGTFYGVDGHEISGVVGFDETVLGPGLSGGYQFLGVAGFSADEE
ncbi:MAG: hypothetical protein GKR98_13605 [Boseongicola sp.]|nr:MAG: hypothetical protein GKR98_13605 [Boseongicola sp.]